MVPIAVGEKAEFRKTVSESDIYLYAGITGDFSPNHVDEEAMRRTAYGRRLAHGTLIMGFMSTTSTMIADRATRSDPSRYAVSLGYDRVRFLLPIFIGDTVHVSYTVAGIDEARARSTADIEVKNQRGDLVAVASHILKWLPATE